MALKTTIDLNVDFYDKKYILINAKQLDRGIKTLDEGVDAEGKEYSRWMDNGSRFLSIACYNHGEPIIFNSGEHAAYVRYKKADGYGVFNFCEIDRKGKIIIGLTEQMLAVDGICVADLVIVDKGKAKVNSDTGEIININETAVLSTMPIHIDVTEAAVNNSDVESTYEFNLLNTKLGEYWADFEDVMKTAKSYAKGNTGIREGENTDNAKYYSQLSKSYAIGNANGVRENEDADNAKYYSEQSSNSADAAAESETKSLEYRNSAYEYMDTTQDYMNTVEEYMETTNSYMGTTKEYMGTTEEHMGVTEGYMTTTNEYMGTTQGYMNLTKEYMDAAETHKDDANASAIDASKSAFNANASATDASTYMVNANEYMIQTEEYKNTVLSVVNGLNSGYIPMGTITFDKLATAEKATGFTYNISDDFVTDERFAEGIGKSYTAGTNVYYTASGYWDCFGGSATPVATVDEVKEYLGI